MKHNFLKPTFKREKLERTLILNKLSDYNYKCDINAIACINLLSYVKMKQILLIIFSCFLGQASFTQSDSVYLSIDSKLISEIQIITPNGENGIRENYTYFKYEYWLGKIDTVSMNVVNEIEPTKSKKKVIQYQKYGACDSIINKIRNSAEYWKMESDINKIAKQEIGYRNEEFNKIRYSESNRIKDFSVKCQDEFNAEISKIKTELTQEIDRIKEVKINRFNRLSANPESINLNAIKIFLETFDLCGTDLKSLELIILKNPNDFINTVDNLSDSNFFTFTLQLDQFPEDSKVLEMKASLKSLDIKSRRKKKIIKKIKNRKVNNC